MSFHRRIFQIGLLNSKVSSLRCENGPSFSVLVTRWPAYERQRRGSITAHKSTVSLSDVYYFANWKRGERIVAYVDRCSIFRDPSKCTSPSWVTPAWGAATPSPLYPKLALWNLTGRILLANRVSATSEPRNLRRYLKDRFYFRIIATCLGSNIASQHMSQNYSFLRVESCRSAENDRICLRPVLMFIEPSRTNGGSNHPSNIFNLGLVNWRGIYSKHGWDGNGMNYGLQVDKWILHSPCLWVQ